MVPETPSMTDRTFGHFRPFLPFYPPNNPTNQNFEKIKKHLEIKLFYTCSVNDNRMMYGSWDIERNGQNFLSFWTIFCRFIFPLIRKFKILKKWKNTWRYYFTYVYHKWQSYNVWFLRYVVWRTGFFFFYDSWDMQRSTVEICSMSDRIFCHFEPFWTLLPP